MSDGSSGKKVPSHDIIRLDDNGRFAKTEIERDGKKLSVNDVIGAAWADDLGENSALLKFEDGTRCKLMSRKKLDAHRAANPKPAKRAKPKKAPKPAAAAPSSTRSKFGKK